MENQKFSRNIEKSARELLSSRKERSNFWRYANVLGVGGWVFVIPVVGGAYLGRYLDKKNARRRHLMDNNPYYDRYSRRYL